MPSYKRIGELNVEKVIKVVEELEESRISGHETSILNTAVRNDQFHATRTWHNLISRFFKTMEVKRCRRLLKSYPDSFVGKCAVEFLVTTVFPKVVPNKPVNETNAETFLKILLKKHLIENVEDPGMKADEFKNNKDKFYRFLDENIAAEIEATAPLRRSNSLKVAKPLTGLNNSQSKNNSTNLDRRISSSYCTLHKLVKTTKMDEPAALNNAFVHSPFSTVTPKTLPETFYEEIQDCPQPSSSSAESGNDGDYLRAWTQSLRTFINNDQMVNGLAQNVNGNVIKWNSTEIGESGVVKICNPKDDLSSDIKKCLKILMNWPADAETSQTNSPITIFEKLCVRLNYLSPIIREFEAKKLVAVLRYFDKQGLGVCGSKNDFSSFYGSVPSTNPSVFSATSLSSKNIQYIDGYDTPVQRNARAQFQKNIADAAAKSDFDSSNASSEVYDISLCNEFKAALQIVLLSFPSGTRRTLHLICRYIKRISNNPKLNLNINKSLLDYLIDRLGAYIFDVSANYISPKDAITLIRLMVEKQTIIFAPSTIIIQNAEHLEQSRLRGTPTRIITTYCHQIDQSEYMRQTDQTKMELLVLLDGIINDENLSENQRQKKLESFRKTYPALYGERFPDASFIKPKRQATPTRIVNSIRSKLTRRNSAKRT